MTTKFSLRRHLTHIHKIPECLNFTHPSKYEYQIAKKTEPTNPPAPTKTEWPCEKCNRTFNRKWSMERHKKICDGTMHIKDARCCQYCNKQFKHTTSKYRHYLICEAKKIKETVKPIVVYKIKDIAFHTESLDATNIISKLKYAVREDAINHEFLADYAIALFKIPENRCIRKTSLHTPYTDIYNGIQWEKKLDKSFYPEIACEIANSFSGFIYQHKASFTDKSFKKIISFVDYMTDKGYVNNDNKEMQKNLLKEYTYLVKSLKLILHDITTGNNGK